MQQSSLVSWTHQAGPLAPLNHDWDGLLYTAYDALRSTVDVVDFAEIDRKRKQAESLTLALVLDVLKRIGAFAALPCSAETFERVHELCGIPAIYQKVLRRWFAELQDLGIVSRTEGGDRILYNQELLDKYSPTSLARNVEFFDDIVDAVVEVLRGKQEILELIYGECRPHWLLAYVSSYLPHTASSMCHDAIAESVAGLARSVSKGRALRILEVGGGSGGLTRRVLDALAEGARTSAVKYAFTDISAFFVNSARKTFAGHDMVFDRYNINADPQQLGYSAQTFDIVLAFDVLHCAKNIVRTLRYLRYLLQPGGVLLAEELTTNSLSHLLFPTMVPGFLDLEDERLIDCRALLSPVEWERRFIKAGYQRAAAVPSEEDIQKQLGEAILLASA